LGGSAEAGCQEGLAARLTAEALGAPYAGNAAGVAVNKTESASALVLLDPHGRTLRSRELGSAVLIEGGLPLRPFTIRGFLAAASKAVEFERWPKRVLPQAVHAREAPISGPLPVRARSAAAGEPQEAALQARRLFGLEAVRPRAVEHFNGPINDVIDPLVLDTGVVAVLAADSEGRIHQTGLNALRAAAVIATFEKSHLGVLMLGPVSESCQRRAISQIAELTNANLVLLPTSRAHASEEIKSRLLVECLCGLRFNPQVVVGEAWTENAFSILCHRPGHAEIAVLRVRKFEVEDDRLIVETSRLHNKLRLSQNIISEPGVTWWIHLAPDAEVSAVRMSPPNLEFRVERWPPRLERFFASQDIQQLLEELKAEAGLVRLSDADFIIDVGFGVGNRDGYEAVIDPLERCLRDLGVRNVLVGGSRKVTEELHLLPPDRQIGQSGVSINPQVLLAVGVSGAPQHLNYIGPRATILAFNRDPEAPIMILNQRAARPKVFPIVGDLFETVPAFISALKEDLSAEPESDEPGRAVPTPVSVGRASSGV
jgi:hypothetical protein